MVLLPGCVCCCTPQCQDICPYYIQFLSPEGFTLGGVSACNSSFVDGLNVSQLQLLRANDFAAQSQNLDASGLANCGYSGSPWTENVRLSQISARIDRTMKYMNGYGVNGYSTFASPTGELTAKYVRTLSQSADLSPLSAKCQSGKSFLATSEISLRFGCNLDEESPGKQRLKIQFTTQVRIQREYVSSDETSANHPCNPYVTGGNYNTYTSSLPAFGGQKWIIKTWDTQNLTAAQYAAIFSDVSIPAYCPSYPPTSCGPHVTNDVDISIDWSGVSGLLSGVSAWHDSYTYTNYGDVSSCFDSYSNASLQLRLGRLGSCTNPLP